MFRVKICGITRVEDALAVARAGADAIGLNFYAQSPRFITTEFAQAVAHALAEASHGEGVVRVGVFVNTPVDQIKQIAREAKLNAVQLHGDEPAEAIRDLVPLPVIRARRLDARGVGPIDADLEECRTLGRLPDALLVDAAAAGSYGGTGQTVDWGLLTDHARWTRGVPLILAGGLRCENVAEAIRAVRPRGIDTASGVESAPGVKDHEKVAAFVQRAREALR
jgi:phosphoribosylanthranilate isomerase